MAGSVMVTLPVLVTWNVYVTTSPAADTVVGVADLVTVNAAVCVAGTVTDDGGDTGGVTPAGGVPVAVAVLVTEPASTSACVTVYVAVQSTLAPAPTHPADTSPPAASHYR